MQFHEKKNWIYLISRVFFCLDFFNFLSTSLYYMVNDYNKTMAFMAFLFLPHGILQQQLLLFFRSVRFFVFLNFFSKNQEDFFAPSVQFAYICFVFFFSVFLLKKLLSTMCISNRS